MAQDDGAVCVDKKGLRNAIDAPAHAGITVAVDADIRKRVAIGGEEASCVFRLVLVGDAENLDFLGKQGEGGRFGPAGRAPAGKDIDKEGRPLKSMADTVPPASLRSGRATAGAGLPTIAEGSWVMSRSPRSVASNARLANPASTRNPARGIKRQDALSAPCSVRCSSCCSLCHSLSRGPGGPGRLRHSLALPTAECRDAAADGHQRGAAPDPADERLAIRRSV